MVLKRGQAVVSAYSAEWDGYLVIPASDEYRFLVFADGSAKLLVDGQVAADATMHTGGAGRILKYGLHSIHMAYVASRATKPGIVLFQSQGPHGVFAPIPRRYLLPALTDPSDIRMRRWTVAAGRWLPAIVLGWCAVTLAAVARSRRRAMAPQPICEWRVITLLVASAALFAVGAWWGLPAYASWAPDEISPADVHDAWRLRFSGGWATKYPPLHYAVLAAAFLPYYVTASFGLSPLSDMHIATSLTLVSRLISVIMGILTVWIVHTLTREHFGPRAGLFAALTVISALPFTYYSKTANLDVPYVFWLTLAFLYYARATAGRRPADFYRFALAGVASICTKDQAYGFFVLPAIYMVLCTRTAPARPGVPSPQVLMWMAALTLAAASLCMNLPFNLNGVIKHFRLITGPDSQSYKMYIFTAPGIVHMALDAVRELAGVMSWPLFVVATAGVVGSLRRRQPVLVLLLLAALSYYLSFLSVVLYQYDRFFLGVVVVLAPAAGCWLARFTRQGSCYRALRLLTVCFVFAYALSRCVGLDSLMLRDSRYAAEQRLRREVRPNDLVGAIGQRVYLTRPEIVPWTLTRATPEDLEQVKPDLLVVNVGYGLRASRGYNDELVRNLLPSSGIYSLVAEYRSKVPFPLSLEPRYSRAEEDEFSNLSKINPVVRLYARQRSFGR